MIPMPANGVTYYAQWAGSDDTPYCVEHYMMNTEGVYELCATDQKSGVTDSIISCGMQKLETLPEGVYYSKAEVDSVTAENTAIKADGSLVIQLYYDRA